MEGEIREVGLAGLLIERLHPMPDLEQFLQTKATTQPFQSFLGMADLSEDLFLVFVDVQPFSEVCFFLLDPPNG